MAYTYVLLLDNVVMAHSVDFNFIVKVWEQLGGVVIAHSNTDHSARKGYDWAYVPGYNEF